MVRVIYALSVTLALTACAFAGFAGETAGKASGEELFKRHCAICHPGGGNIINPAKTLQKKSREAGNIKQAEDIVKQMRNPGPGMTPFDKTTLPDSDAGKIADYILKTFN